MKAPVKTTRWSRPKMISGWLGFVIATQFSVKATLWITKSVAPFCKFTDPLIPLFFLK